MESQGDRERRQFYRLRYPRLERPGMRCGGCIYEVVEVSEGGARLMPATAGTLEPECEFSAVMEFPGGARDHVSGIALRFEGRELIVRFTHGITLKRMLQEQLRLRATFPLFFETPQE